MEMCNCNRKYGIHVKNGREHCNECGQLIGERVIDTMDSVEDGPMVRQRRAVPRYSDIARAANKIYDIYTPSE